MPVRKFDLRRTSERDDPLRRRLLVGTLGEINELHLFYYETRTGGIISRVYGYSLPQFINMIDNVLQPITLYQQHPMAYIRKAYEISLPICLNESKWPRA